MTSRKFAVALFVCAVIGARAEAQEAPIGGEALHGLQREYPRQQLR